MAVMPAIVLINFRRIIKFIRALLFKKRETHEPRATPRGTYRQQAPYYHADAHKSMHFCSCDLESRNFRIKYGDTRTLLREIKFAVATPGFRTKHITVITTLLDHKQYPEETFADLYRRRWLVELFLRDIKIAMNMDVLRCKTPDRMEKELYMHLIAHNLVRTLMLQAAAKKQKAPLRLSFKGTVAAVRQWTPIMAYADMIEPCHQQMLDALLNAIAGDPVPQRPDRVEPRARKRRPKNYQLLTKPRKEFKEYPHRSRYGKA